MRGGLSEPLSISECTTIDQLGIILMNYDYNSLQATKTDTEKILFSSSFVQITSRLNKLQICHIISSSFAAKCGLFYLDLVV